MYTKIRTLGSKLKGLSFLFGIFWILFIFLGSFNSGASDDDGIDREEAYFSSYNVNYGVLDGKVNTSSPRHKRHYFIASRKSYGQFILKDDDAPSVGILDTFGTLATQAHSLVYTFLRPSYYVFLFLYALF